MDFKKKRVNHIVLLRTTAILLVVLGHATRSVHSPNPHMYNPTLTPMWETTLKSYIYSFHMPLFFWISGFTYYYSSVEFGKKNTWMKQIINKLKRLIMPMYATSLLILLPTIIFFGNLNGSLLNQIKLFVLAVNNDHLWFLKSLFIIFLFIIPVDYILNKKDKNFYFIIISIWCLIFISQSYLPAVARAPHKYFPFFLLGFFFRQYEELFDNCHFLIFGIAAFILHFLFLFSIYIDFVLLPATIMWYVIAILGIYFMYFFARKVTKVLESKRIWQIVEYIDKKSYSIYLFHVPSLYMILFLHYHIDMQLALIRVFFAFIFGIWSSLLLNNFLSLNKLLSYIFEISYRKRKNFSQS